jgi:hypothetical protein
MKDPAISNAWLAAYCKELEVLTMTACTFSIEDLQEKDTCTLVFETNKIKVKSGGSLDKLKVCILVHVA